MKKNVGGQKIGAQMVAAANGSAFTSPVSVYVTGDKQKSQVRGAVGDGVCAHEGNGYHSYLPAQAETNHDMVAFTFVGQGAVPATMQVYTADYQAGDSAADIAKNVAAIKAKTDAIPQSPASASDIASAVSALAEGSARDAAGVRDSIESVGASIDIRLGTIDAVVSEVRESAASAATSAAVASVREGVDAVLAATTAIKAKIDSFPSTPGGTPTPTPDPGMEIRGFIPLYTTKT